MCEMLRVAKKGIVVLEARDSFLMRLAVRLGLSVDFELEPAIVTDGRSGGYRDGPIPNYIYRWTEREVEKTATSFEPAEIFEFSFFYGLTLPLQRISMSTNHVKVFAVHVIRLTSLLFKAFLPAQGNNFAFVVRRTGRYRPWLLHSHSGPMWNPEYVHEYDPLKYRR